MRVHMFTIILAVMILGGVALIFAAASTVAPANEQLTCEIITEHYNTIILECER